VRKVTVSIDEITYRRAAAVAARRHVTLSALVRRFLADLAHDMGDFEHLKREEAAVRASIRRFRASNRLSRDDLHRRDR
jgi:hypothetical protein